MTTPDRMTPADLWAEIQKARAAYTAVYAGLTEEEMTRRPGPQDDWSVKDQIAHLTWWEDLALLRSALMLAGQKTTRLNDFDAINARVLGHSQAMSLAEVLAAFEANLARLGALCAALSDEELNDETDTRRPPYWLLVTDTLNTTANTSPTWNGTSPA